MAGAHPLAEPILIDGLRQFQKDLAALDSELPKALKRAMTETAEPIAQEARTRVPSRSGRARKTVKAKSTRTRVRVAGGSKRAPYYPWLDFGDKSGIGPNFSVHRPFKTEGRYIYDVFFKHQRTGTLEENMTAALLRVAGQAGVTVD